MRKPHEPLSKLTLEKIVIAAPLLLEEVIRRLNLDPKNRGGFQVLGDERGFTTLMMQVGSIRAEASMRSRRRNAEEKVRRMAKGGDVSSWVSRNFDKRKYGGGVRMEEFADRSGEIPCRIHHGAFSGLPEHADEIYQLLLQGSVFGIRKIHLMQVIEISGNPHYPLFEDMFSNNLLSR